MRSFVMRCLTAMEIGGTISSGRRLCVRALMIALACTVPATFLYAQVGADESIDTESIDTLAKEL